MRVAYVCADLGVPIFGSKGCSVHVQAYLRAFLQRGADVTLVTRQIGGDVPQEFDVVRTMRLPKPLVTDAAAREQALLAGNAEIDMVLEAIGPFDLVYERYALWSYAAMTYARRHGIPGLLEVNAPLIDEQDRHRVLVDKSGALQTSLRAFDAASLLVAVSKQVAEGLPETPGLAEKTIVVPNGVDVDRFTPRPDFDRPNKPFTIGFVGSLRPWHGLDELVHAFRLVTERDDEVRLLIVGDGQERERIERMLEALELNDHVRFAGAVSHEEVPRWIWEMDVALAPYPRASDCYFSPLKLYEYMACGVPVVASDAGQISDTITDKVDGLLYPPGEVEALARAIFAVKKDPVLASELGRAARSAAVSKHTWSASLERVLSSVEFGIPIASEAS